MPEKQHEHEWSLVMGSQDTRCCASCSRVEVFVSGEWQERVERVFISEDGE